MTGGAGRRARAIAAKVGTGFAFAIAQVGATTRPSKERVAAPQLAWFRTVREVSRMGIGCGSEGAKTPLQSAYLIALRCRHEIHEAQALLPGFPRSRTPHRDRGRPRTCAGTITMQSACPGPPRGRDRPGNVQCRLQRSREKTRKGRWRQSSAVADRKIARLLPIAVGDRGKQAQAQESSHWRKQYDHGRRNDKTKRSITNNQFQRRPDYRFPSLCCNRFAKTCCKVKFAIRGARSEAMISLLPDSTVGIAHSLSGP